MTVSPGTSLSSMGVGPLAISSSSGAPVSAAIQSTIIMANAADKGPATQAMAQAVSPSFVAGPAIETPVIETDLTNDTFAI
mgnify:CR=1 FL=1